MTQPFSLAGLLRLRRLEEEQAAAVFGAAASRHAGIAARTERALAEVDRLPTDVDSLDVMHTIAAGRASSAAMLTELRALADTSAVERATAEREFGAARARTLGLEKLEARHASTVHAAELAAEQVVLDELGSTARLRAPGRGAPGSGAPA
jgi:flagellar FliJ protein